MGNIFLTPSIIAKQALANLYETNLMAGLVWRDFDAEFTGKIGDTVTIRRPPVFVAGEYVRSAGIQIQDANETGIPVVLNHFADVSFAVTTEELTLQIEDFNEQLLGPAMEAITQKIDADLLLLRNDITAEVGQTSGEMWNDPRVMIACGRVLDQAKVPASERRAVAGPVTAAEWIKDDLMNRFDARGDTEGRLEASLGPRMFGFDPYKTNHIHVPPVVTGNSTTEVGVAFHRTAFALVTRPLALPRGSQNAAIAQYKGFGLRVVYDYDLDLKSDVISIDTMYGTKTIDSNRAVLIKGSNVP